MKRVIQRKAEQNIYGELSKVVNASKEQKRASQDIGNKTRTSAAMLGLALSMGASGSLLACHKGAIAAEPNPASLSSVESDLGLDEYVIREGETLWSLAERYQMSSASLAELNGFEADVVLRVGQVVKVPHRIGISQTGHQLMPEPVVKATGQNSSKTRTISGTDSQVLENLAQLQVQGIADTPANAVPPNIFASTPEHLVKDVVAVRKASVTELPPSLQPTPTAQPEESSADSDVVEVPSRNSTDTAAYTDSEETVFPAIGSNEVVSDTSDSDAIALSDVPSATVEKPSAALRDISPTDRVSSDDVHRIEAGETLATIARHYGISTQQLIDANRIYNPNRIFAGQVLNLPVEATVAAVPESVGSGYYVIPGAPNEIDIQEPQVEPLDAQPTLPEASQPVDGSFYVRQLLDEIEEMADSHHSEPLSQQAVSVESPASVELLADDAVPTNVAYVPGIGSPELEPPASLLEQPQDIRLFPSSVPEEAAGSDEISLPDGYASPAPGAEVVSEQEVQTTPQLVASAPLGSESYVPLNQPVTGRMVSPDLPPLAGPDNYLPDSSGSFNGYLYPAQGTLTSGYGWRWGRMHRGIDVAAPVGTPIVAAAPGVVEFSGWNSGGYGNMVEVRHPDGSMTRYAHNSRNFVRVGQRVAQGEQIAAMGSTGFSTGPHVHFEIHIPDQGAVNPIAYLIR
ncbi:MAG: peptidoglycan DD-metalloendopeptidase family protein [Merismopedia sp. SIO2A8]|nr:peptidoglycan DD-metalloendopeptidase family protein [Merismopedia sp. SIO2A8]